MSALSSFYSSVEGSQTAPARDVTLTASSRCDELYASNGVLLTWRDASRAQKLTSLFALSEAPVSQDQLQKAFVGVQAQVSCTHAHLLTGKGLHNTTGLTTLCRASAVRPAANVTTAEPAAAGQAPFTTTCNSGLAKLVVVRKVDMVQNSTTVCKIRSRHGARVADSRISGHKSITVIAYSLHCLHSVSTHSERRLSFNF